MNTSQSDTSFVQVSKKAFTRSKGGTLPGWMGTLVGNASAFFNQGWYKSETLEEALKGKLPALSLFGGTFEFQYPSVKTAVTTATKQGQVIVLGNYNRSPPQRGRYRKAPFT